MANSRAERFAFGMKRPSLSVDGLTIPGQFLDRASEKWNVVSCLLIWYSNEFNQAPE